MKGKVIAEADRTEIAEGNHYFPSKSLRWEFFQPSDTICPESAKLTITHSSSKEVADAAPTPYAIAASMLLHQIDDRRAMLRGVLKSQRVLVAKDILADIDETERALRARADLLGESNNKQRLDDLMAAVDALVAAEVGSLPGNLHHVLGARGTRGPSFTGRLTSLVTGGAAYCKKLIT